MQGPMNWMTQTWHCLDVARPSLGFANCDHNFASAAAAAADQPVVPEPAPPPDPHPPPTSISDWASIS